MLGTLSFKASNWADAETNLRKSIDALPQQPDIARDLSLGGCAGYAEQVSRKR